MALLLRRSGGALRRAAALHSGAAAQSRPPPSHPPISAPLPNAAASSWDATRKLADRAAQRLAAYENAPVSGHGGTPPPEVSPEELATWERRLGGTAHAFPDWIESFSRRTFYRAGVAGVAAAGAVATAFGPLSVPALAVAAPVAAWWLIGLRDISQTRHTVRRNFPVLGNVRYMFETIRPEIRQYFIESDTESVPFSRLERSIVYQRAKGAPDTLSFGTRQDVHAIGYEYCRHSMAAHHVPSSASRVPFGGEACAPRHRYSASLLNVSGMSYGALSDNAILALNTAARLGGFYHNTGEGGISRFHLAPGGDIVWNIGSGYFGCRTEDGKFSPERFMESVSPPAVKMIELKLSQGAKPAHGGILPAAKVTPAIAEARGVPLGRDCLSPLRHSAFSGPHGLVLFLQRLRELSGGKPVGFKLCVGQQEELCAVVRAMVDLDITPDFITVDGAEGGTGAAPPEFSNSVGAPMEEGLTLVHGVLRGAGLRHRVRLVAAGKILTGFGVVRTLALGADACNAARAMMFALGCIQALKCNSNACPTGVATQNPELTAGLVPEDKALRVYRYHHATVASALELIGAMGLTSPADVSAAHLMRRVSATSSLSFAELYPPVPLGSLLTGEGPRALQKAWDAAGAAMAHRDAPREEVLGRAAAATA